MTTAIRTDYPLIKNRSKNNHTIAHFWDKISAGWSKIWGTHIHHGYYENEEEGITPLQAQEALIQKLIVELELKSGSQILDVGCGLGGSACYLAEHHQAWVNGITLSQKQITLANELAMGKKIKQVKFSLEDALSLTSFAHDSFDVIWSLESCEQFCDKSLFIEKAFNKLRPGGKLLLVTWCSSQEKYEGKDAKKYKKLCRAFDLPYMPTIAHYQSLLSYQGFKIIKSLDWTDKVKRSWAIGRSLTQAFSFLQILRLSGWRGFLFTRQLQLMQQAFNEDRIKYGVFVAVKS